MRIGRISFTTSRIIDLDDPEMVGAAKLLLFDDIQECVLDNRRKFYNHIAYEELTLDSSHISDEIGALFMKDYENE